MVLLAFTAPSPGHNGEPIPIPPEPRAPEPGAIANITELKPERWSWLHWWEANRDPYLHAIRQRAELQPPDPAVLAAIRAEAAAALRQMLRSDFPAEQAAAAVALGRIGDTDALAELKSLATGGGSEIARWHSLLAIGLLGAPQSEPTLIGPAPGTPMLQRTTLAAVGLLPDARQETLQRLWSTVQQGDAALATIAMWSLRRHSGANQTRELQRLLLQTSSFWLASETLLALGDGRDPQSLRLLVEMLLGGQQALRFPAFRTLRELDAAKRAAAGALTANRILYEQRYKEYQRKAEDYRSKFNPNLQTQPRRPPGYVDVVIGEESIFLSRLRASAAIALGGWDDPIATRALLMLLREPDDEWNALPKGMAIMSLGQTGDKQALPALVGVLNVDRRNLVALEHPLRGYAAVALGLYSRPVQTPQGSADRPAFDKALGLLAERMADPAEPQEVRCAAAVGLGLAGRTAALRPLHHVVEQLTERDEMLIGYTLLARGMLGDRNIVPIARRFLARERDKVDMSGILARRAAVLGLGLCGADEAVPVLTEAWHLNHYVNREVILALSLCEAQGVGRLVTRYARESKDPQERAFMAMVLGELLTTRRPDRLAGFINASNYTLKDHGRMPYQRLANEFMFGYLLQAFGDMWR